jgi:hypothetical protein
MSSLSMATAVCCALAGAGASEGRAANAMQVAAKMNGDRIRLLEFIGLPLEISSLPLVV